MTSDKEMEHGLPTPAGVDMLCVLDTEQTCLSVNGAFLGAFGKQEKDLIGQRATDSGGRESFAGLIEGSVDRALGGESVSTQRWWDFPRLGFRYIRIGLEPVRNDTGVIAGVCVCVRDLTDARLAQEALEESEQRFADFAEVVSDWLWELDEKLRFVYLSARFEEIMGMPREQVLGRRRIELFPEEDHAGAATRNHHLDLEHRRPFDDYQFTRILDDGSHDTLTGLVNRQEFLQRLQRVVDTAAGGDSEHGLCYVDVDRFRSINDRCGHPAGDQLLVELAELLGEQIRRRDTLARVGGNAFAILMEHCSLPQIERVAESVKGSVGEYPFMHRDASISVTVTIGVVTIDAGSRSVEGVLRAADRACYAAKSAGGDRILVYGRSDPRASRERRAGNPEPVTY
jgi:diguanylate cyclase (GGDEF)-like protein/PAS domain S-box-containing protein